MDNAMNWPLPWGVVVAILFGIVSLRATGTYYIGRAIVTGTAKSRWNKLVESRAYKVGSSGPNRLGAPAVPLCFLTVGVQTAVLLAAGISRMPWRKYLVALIPGAIMWGLMYGTVGFVGFVALKRLWTFSPVLTSLSGTLVLATLVWGLRSMGKKQRNVLVDEPLPTPRIPGANTAP